MDTAHTHTTSLANTVEPAYAIDKVCVIGLGYVGLPSAALMASVGLEVVGVDVQPDVVDTINQGKIHIIEADLDALVQEVVQSEYLRASLAPEAADVFVIAVPTPIAEDKSPDIAYVEAAVKAIAPALEQGNLVIIESTSPVGTTQRACAMLTELRPDLRMPYAQGDDHDVHIAYCPERILPGQVLKELVENNRTIGGMTPICAEHAAAFYRRFVRGSVQLTNAPTAELVKLAENAYRDVNIAYANELANICDHHGISVQEVIRSANQHPRVNILTPGIGVGGHCIPVDPWFIVHGAPEHSPLIYTARKVNDARPELIAEQIVATIKERNVQSVACLGLSYKPDIDDVRESPAIDVVARLNDMLDDSVTFYLSDPHLDALPKALSAYAKLHYVPTEQAVHNAALVVTLVAHQALKSLPSPQLHGRLLMDYAGIWSV